ncbi:MAG: hypothetical protein ACREBI_11075 [Nitrosotalea sp.]
MSQVIKLRCTGCGNEFIGFHSMTCLICGCDAFPEKQDGKIRA